MFFSKREQVVLWQMLEQAIEPFYHKPKTGTCGRRPLRAVSPSIAEHEYKKTVKTRTKNRILHYSVYFLNDTTGIRKIKRINQGFLRFFSLSFQRMLI